MIEGGTRKKVTIQFTPDINYEQFSKLPNHTFYTYSSEYEMRLLFGENIEKMKEINDFYLCSFPYDTLDDIVNTLRNI